MAFADRSIPVRPKMVLALVALALSTMLVPMATLAQVRFVEAGTARGPMPVPPITFDVEVNDPLAEAFFNQVLGLVGDNLAQTAQVQAPSSLVDITALLTFDALQSDVVLAEEVTLAGADLSMASELILDDAEVSEAAVSADLHSFPNAEKAEGANAPVQTPSLAAADIGAARDTGTRLPSAAEVSGGIRHLDSGVMEIVLFLGRGDSAGTDVQINTLMLRADATQWRAVAHYVSNTLHQIVAQSPGQFDSQILFVTHEGRQKGRLALIDQDGGGFEWIEAAGDAVRHAEYLDNRAEIAFLRDDEPYASLMHHNRATGQTTLLARLPEVQGAPDVALGGRLIAFAASELTTPGTPEGGPSDIYLADVARGQTYPVSIPGSRDIDPALARDLRALALVTTRPTWSELLITDLPRGLGGDRRENPWAGWRASVRSVYGSPLPLRSPAWSPDGTQIAFIEMDPAGPHRLMIYDLATREARAMAQAPHLANPTWGPNPGQLALIGEDSQGMLQLYRLNLNSQSIRPLVLPQAPLAASWSPAVRRDGR